MKRSSTDRLIAGVCGGMGEATGVDSVVLRVGFVCFGIFSAIIPAIIVYAILAIFMRRP